MGRTEAQLEGYRVITTIQLSLCLNSFIFLIAKRFLPACGLTFIHICLSSCGYAHLQSLFSYRHCIPVVGNVLISPILLPRPAETSAVDVTKEIFHCKTIFALFVRFTSNK